MRAWWKRMAVGVLVLEGLYILTVAAFLNSPSGLLHLLENDPSLQLKYGFGWSWYPGDVQVWGFEMAIQDREMQLHFTADRASFRLNLEALRHKTFEASHLRIRELRLQVLRLKPDRARDPATLESLPRMPVFPPLAHAAFSRPADQHWKVILDDVSVAHFKEFWVDRQRFEGDGTLQGDFALHTGGHRLKVRSILIRLDGNLRSGKNAVAEDLHANARIAFSEIEPRRLRGPEIFRAMDADLELISQISDLAFLNYYVRTLRGVEFSEGQGATTASIHVREGRLTEDSKLLVKASKLHLQLWRQELRGDGQVTLRFEGNHPLVEAKLDRYDLWFGKATRRSIRGENLLFTVRTPQLDFAAPLPVVAVELKMPSAEVEDLSILNGYLPRASGVKFIGGKTKIEVDIHASSDRALTDGGTLRIAGQKVAVQVKGKPLVGNVVLDAKLSKAKIQRGIFDISGTKLKLTGFAFGEEPSWWMTVFVDEAQWRLNDGIRALADLRLEAQDLRFLLDLYLYSNGGSLPGVVRNMLSFDGVKAKARVAVDDAIFDLRSLHAAGETSSLWGNYHEAGKERDGRLLFQYGPFAAGLEIHNEKVDVKLNNAFGWYKSRPMVYGRNATP